MFIMAQTSAEKTLAAIKENLKNTVYANYQIVIDTVIDGEIKGRLIYNNNEKRFFIAANGDLYFAPVFLHKIMKKES